MREIVRTSVLSAGMLVAFAQFALGQSCNATAGPQRAQELVRQCRDVSPATHPPCNGENACDLIISEIRRGCGMLTSDIPGYCRQYR